jgi:phosphatidylserine decarboxylase
MSAEPIRFWDRRARRLDTEKVYGERFVRWTYETSPGRSLTDLILARPWVSQAYGWTQTTRWSSRKVPEFIRKFSIPMEEYERPPEGFTSFNSFFIRKFKPGLRPFAQADEFPAPAEARYLAFERVRDEQSFPVKGTYLSAAALVGDEKEARPFRGGPLLLARLCPVDYHRYHYPDDGTTLSQRTLHGPLHSVNPLALKAKGDILSTNERRVSILDTALFGKLAYIEVGALCVGKIVQTHPLDQPFRRGDEKGYFLFGGSTVIVLGEPGRWYPDADLLEQTQAGRESLVRLGERVASAKRV